MNTIAITVNINEEAVRRIAVLFGDDVSTQEGSEDFSTSEERGRRPEPAGLGRK